MGKQARLDFEQEIASMTNIQYIIESSRVLNDDDDDDADDADDDGEEVRLTSS